MASVSNGPGSFGQLLRRLRIAAGLTQQALSERSGISVDAISALENGRNRRPHRDTLSMLADGLGLGPAEREVLAATARSEGRPRPARGPGRLPEHAAVFLSHTSELRDHPAGGSFVAAAEAAAIGAGYAVTDMDCFPPSDSEPSDYCTALVARSDVYVGIIGTRYGLPVRGRPELSHTELEFEAATVCGLPRLVFLVREDASSLPPVSQPEEHNARQRAFRDRLREAGVTVSWIATPAELQSRLHQALVALRGPARARPAPVPNCGQAAAEARCAACANPRPVSLRHRWRRRAASPAARPSWRRPGRLLALAATLSVLGAGMVVLRQPGAAPASLPQARMASVQFVGSLAQPASESLALTRNVLRGFDGAVVEFNSQPTAAEDIQTILNTQQTGISTIDLTDLTHSDMVALRSSDALEDLNPLLRRLRTDRQFPETLLTYGKLGTQKQYYIPWLQATYMMAVDKRALPYLPPGASADHLTYDELIEWGQNILAGTGQRKIGLPADLDDGVKGGLVYRFLQGYAYPSFTGTTLTGFKSSEAVQMWQTLRRLWAVTNPQSSSYASMQEPLENGDVWIAWDHQARLKDALADTARFEAVPAPSGPRGLGYMSVVVGLAIPKGSPNRAAAEALIDYLTHPAQQAAASTSLGFFPVVQGVRLTGSGAPGYLAAESGVAAAYASSRNAVVALLPAGLGSRTDQFTLTYQDTFTRIIRRGEDIQTVLNDEAGRLQALLNAANAGCWPPDRASAGPCQLD